MSGVPIPLSSRVACPDGGKFAGIRTIVVSIALLLQDAPRTAGPRAAAPLRPLVERELPFAELQTSRRGLGLRRREVRRHRLRIAVDEVEDAVSARDRGR